MENFLSWSHDSQPVLAKEKKINWWKTRSKHESGWWVDGLSILVLLWKTFSLAFSPSFGRFHNPFPKSSTHFSLFVAFSVNIASPKCGGWKRKRSFGLFVGRACEKLKGGLKS